MALKYYSGITVAENDATIGQVFNKIAFNTDQIKKKNDFVGVMMRMSEPKVISSFAATPLVALIDTTIGANLITRIEFDELVSDPYDIMKGKGFDSLFPKFSFQYAEVECFIDTTFASGSGKQIQTDIGENNFFQKGCVSRTATTDIGHGANRISWGHIISAADFAEVWGALQFVDIYGGDNVTFPFTIESAQISMRVFR